MMIWVLFALMTGAAVMAVLWPLSRRNANGAESDLDAAFYRDQLAEIDRDLGRGLLTADEAEAARAEAGRRLLRASAAGHRSSGTLDEPALRRRRAASAIALSTVPLLALAVYGAYGSPQLPGQPLAARLHANPHADPQRIDLAEAVARIEAHLARAPDDGRGWEVLAPVYLRNARFEDAAKAYGAAIRLLGETASRLASYGEALVSAKAGVVSAEARAVFERALELDRDNPKARFYLARAAEQDGDFGLARTRYSDLIAAAAQDAPWLPFVKERLAALEGDNTASAVALLPGDEQQAAIKGMVASLAARLERQGGTVDEWSRLVRSQLVMGDRARAAASLAKARANLGHDAAAAERLEALARDLGLGRGEAAR